MNTSNQRLLGTCKVEQNSQSFDDNPTPRHHFLWLESPCGALKCAPQVEHDRGRKVNAAAGGEDVAGGPTGLKNRDGYNDGSIPEVMEEIPPAGMAMEEKPPAGMVALEAQQRGHTA